MKKLICIILIATIAFAQFIDLGTQVKGQLDLTSKVKGILPFTNLPTPPYGTQGVFASIPATCATGNLYFATDKPPGNNLYGCTAGNVWTLLSGGSGNVNVSTGIGAPTGACTIGQTWYLNTTPSPKEMWFCDTATGIWQKILSTLNTGDGKLCLPGVTSGVACITVNDVAGTPADMKLPTVTGGANTFLKTDGGSPQQLSWAPAGASIQSGLYASVPTCNIPFFYITTDSALEGLCDGTNLFWKFKGMTVTPTVVGDLPTWFNQGTASTVSYQGSWVLQGTSDSGDNLRGRYKTAPATPYTLITCTQGLAGSNPNSAFGMFWTDGTKLVPVQYVATSSNGPVINIAKYTNSTTFNSYYIANNNGVQPTGDFCLALSDNGTNRRVLISFNNNDWIFLHTVADTDFLTITGVGVVVNSAGTNLQPAMHIFSVKTLTSAL